MEQHDLINITHDAQTQQRNINLAFEYLFGCVKSASEQKDPDIMRGMLNGAIENLERDLK